MRANIPMLPNIAGEKETVSQTLVYVSLLLPAELLLVSSTETIGALSLFVLLGLHTVFVLKILRLRAAIREHSAISSSLARQVFSYSIIYLSLLFVTLVLDTLF